MPDPRRVLILHNIPGAATFSETYRESDVGVLEQVEAVSAALRRLGIAQRTVGIRSLRDLPEVFVESAEPIIFNLVESLAGDPLDHLLVPAFCWTHGKACTGSDTACLLLAQDKWRTKCLLRAEGISCPSGFVVPVGGSVIAEEVERGGYIVKPALGDASEGIEGDSVVKGDPAAIQRRVEELHRRFHCPALVERFISGREINISLLQRGDSLDVLPLAEIVFEDFGDDRPRIVGYAAKWTADAFEFAHTPRVIPAPLSPAVENELRGIAVNAWRILGCNDYVRVDLRLTDEGQPFVLEVNPNPDISPSGGFHAALEAGGITYDAFVGSLIHNALDRIDSPMRPRPPISLAAARGTSELLVRVAEERDMEDVISLLQQTQRFRPGELDVAREVLAEALEPEMTAHYESLVAEHRGKPVGWVCFGPTPCTEGTFDLYWIAVSPAWHRRGVGRGLLQRAEERIRERAGRMIVVETSGRGDYGPARAFYRRNGYVEMSRIADFYARGDDKVVYAKFFEPSR